METEALRGLVYGGVPWGTSSKNGPKGNEGIRLKANRYAYRLIISFSSPALSCIRIVSGICPGNVWVA